MDNEMTSAEALLEEIGIGFDLTEVEEKAEGDDGADEGDKGVDEIKKIVFRNGKKTIVNVKRMSAAERAKRSKAAKKAARGRKGRKLSAATRRKMAKSLAARARA